MEFFRSSLNVSPRLLLIVACGVSLGVCCGLLACYGLFPKSDHGNSEQAPYDLVGKTDSDLSGAQKKSLDQPSLADIISIARPSEGSERALGDSH